MVLGIEMVVLLGICLSSQKEVYDSTARFRLSE